MISIPEYRPLTQLEKEEVVSFINRLYEYARITDIQNGEDEYTLYVDVEDDMVDKNGDHEVGKFCIAMNHYGMWIKDRNNPDSKEVPLFRGGVYKQWLLSVGCNRLLEDNPFLRHTEGDA